MANILIVEDDENIAQLLVFMFRREGYEVTRFSDGAAALHYIEHASPPDVALLDGMLPYRDGLELLKSMRALTAWASVPVIFLSARTLERDVVAALDAGATDYVSKPFQPEELIARVRRVLPKVYA